MEDVGFFARIKRFILNIFLMPIRISKISSVVHNNKNGMISINKDIASINKEIVDIAKELVNLKWEISKISKELMIKNYTIIANRQDGLGMRLLAILNAIALSDALKCNFRFTWDVRLEKDQFHAISPAEKIFSEDFIKDSFYSKRLRALPHVHNMYSTDDNGKWFECGQTIHGSFLEKNNIFLDYRKAFEKIVFSEHVQEAISAAKDVYIDDSTVAIQMRAGDLIYGQYKYHTTFYSKVILYPIALEAIVGLLNDNKKIIIFGQDDSLISEIVEFFGYKNICSSKSLVEKYDFDNEQVAFFDMFLMSRCKHTYAKNSGFALISSKIAERPLEVLSVNQKNEKEIIYKNIDLIEVSKEQYSYAIMGAIYHTDLYDHNDSKETLDLVKKGLLRDGDNLGLHFYVLIFNLIYSSEETAFDCLKQVLLSHKERFISFLKTTNVSSNKSNYTQNNYFKIIGDKFSAGSRAAVFLEYCFNHNDAKAQKDIMAKNEFLFDYI